MSKPQVYARAVESSAYVQQHIPASLNKPSVGIICGSGLGGLADAVRDDLDQAEIQYGDIPYFPQSTVHGHVGKLLFGFMGAAKQPVVLMVGRAHFYEGHSIDDITFPVRVLKLLGIDTLIVTNAAGGLNPDYSVGDLVLLHDHLNLAGLAGVHPLRGPNVDDFGTRFPPLSDAYDLELRRRTHLHWQAMVDQRTNVSRKLHEGVYAYAGGPSYETRAECRMLRMLGADVVGMSTVPEIIVARHCGLQVLAFSLVTNKAVLTVSPLGDDPSIAGKDHSSLISAHAEGKASHGEVLQAGVEAAKDMQLLVYSIVSELPRT